MADGSLIGWTDATWQVVTGCSVTSPGCRNCYAMKLAGTRLKHHPSRIGLTQITPAGPVWTGEVRLNPQWLQQPLLWKRSRKIFVAAHGDLFHEEVPAAWIDQVFAVMALAPQHAFQVLTKRARRMRDYIMGLGTEEGLQRLRAAARALPGVSEAALAAIRVPMRHVWLGASVEDQQRATERRQAISEISDAGWITWVSYEPALGPVDWHGWEFLDWMVAGAEAGPGARPSHPAWFTASQAFCQRAGVAFNFKQWGNFAPWEPGIPGRVVHVSARDGLWGDAPGYVDGKLRPDTRPMAECGKLLSGRTLDGRIYDEYPEGHADGVMVVG